MYYHGRLEDGTQMTRVAVYSDGIHFTSHDDILGNPSALEYFNFETEIPRIQRRLQTNRSGT